MYCTRLTKRIRPANLSGRIVLPYLDDCATPCADFAQGLDRLRAILERISWANLSISAAKLICFATELSYLGYVVGRNGLQCCPKKLEAVARVDPRGINTLQRVQSWLGLCGFYRNLVAGYSTLSRPLVDLCKKGVDVS